MSILMATKVLSDQELIRLYIAGDEKAFENLLLRNKDRIFGYIISKVRNQNLANDIFQDVFIKVIKTLKNGSYNEEGKFLPWVLTISHNMVVDHFRKSNKMQMVSESSSKSDDFNIFSVLKLTDKNVEDDINDLELASLFKKAQLLSDKQKDTVKDFLSAFVLKADLTQKLSQ